MNTAKTIPAVVLADLVNTSRTKTIKYRPEGWRATATIRVIAPQNCQEMTIDLSKPDKPKVKCKVIKNPLTLHG